MKTNVCFTTNNVFHTGIQYLVVISFMIVISSQATAWGSNEFPLNLPKVEGSKSFDMEIDQFNNAGIKHFQNESFIEAERNFRKGLNLARQLRDPSLGILNYNLALSLHKSGRHETATPYFTEARKYARGNKVILDSALLKKHECGFNPSIECKNLPSADMTIEGSN
ncbi:MAG: tetratricopeptide repeat protein [Candidatus Nitronauta litoralis]|uniref:Tetratricopeptide repeat protein n=1 Tax=Candidatus Nitronauta litoralis TaxID=2705533 RepID=A0A7T0BX08_9BACT|nr:MAG: tetratricopeptide repeat protein [Candidatus Nitronauta litoralis]